MKSQKGFIQIPIIIVITIGVLVLGGTGYFGYTKYKSSKEKSVVLEQEKQKESQKELESLRQEIEKIKNQTPQVVTKTVIKEIPVTTPVSVSPPPKTVGEPSISTVVKNWTSRVAKISCTYVIDSELLNDSSINYYFDYFDIGTGPQAGSGSGFLTQITDLKHGGRQIVIMTNAHVLEGHNGFSGANSCTIQAGGYSQKIGGDDIIWAAYTDNHIEMIDGVPFYVSDRDDWAYLPIKNPPPEIEKLAQEKSRCTTQPTLGEEIVVLGFPGVGSTGSITATEGIISGIEPDYYVTSAKIERGNSGGAAFWVKENCYLGIPSYAAIGQIESLGRILKISVIFPKP